MDVKGNVQETRCELIDPLTFDIPPITFGPKKTTGWKYIAKVIIGDHWDLFKKKNPPMRQDSSQSLSKTICSKKSPSRTKSLKTPKNRPRTSYKGSKQYHPRPITQSISPPNLSKSFHSLQANPHLLFAGTRASSSACRRLHGGKKLKRVGEIKVGDEVHGMRRGSKEWVKVDGGMSGRKFIKGGLKRKKTVSNEKKLFYKIDVKRKVDKSMRELKKNLKTMFKEPTRNLNQSQEFQKTSVNENSHETLQKSSLTFLKTKRPMTGYLNYRCQTSNPMKKSGRASKKGSLLGTGSRLLSVSYRTKLPSKLKKSSMTKKQMETLKLHSIYYQAMGK
ncbi:unnamed protein product [Moneuplotes crassus]|uniref:Uncharacterized protein n=1 Tax=Euplotes crassus TaxID=5936 RepID=A0AAD1XG50_EUPCR|nr:unnamed protein product [Moneuplotes crassus]